MSPGLPHAPFTTQLPHSVGSGLGLSEAEVIALIEANAKGITPSAPIEPGKTRAAKTLFEVSATKDALVILNIKPEKGFEASITVKVGGVEIFGLNNPKVGNQATEGAGQSLILTFLVPKGKKWEYEVGVGEIKGAFSTYYTLN